MWPGAAFGTGDDNWTVGQHTASGGAYTLSDGEHVWTRFDNCGTGGAQGATPFR